MTSAQRRARADAIIQEADRSGKGIIAAIEVVNRRLFRETGRRAAITETAPARPASRPAVGKPAKPSKKAQRIAVIVRETLTAAAAPKPAPGTTAARPRATPKAPAKALHEMSGDELDTAAAAAYSEVAGRSPFWTQPARESAPTAPVLEAAPPTPGYPQGRPGATLPTVGVPAIPPTDPSRPLHQMNSDDFLQLSAAWYADQARQDHRSPFWQAA